VAPKAEEKILITRNTYLSIYPSIFELCKISRCVYFADQPTTVLKMGSSLNPDDIKEGDDAYFECIVQSNPKPYKMSWFHNVSNNYWIKSL